jgi:hypothetical protein
MIVSFDFGLRIEMQSGLPIQMQSWLKLIRSVTMQVENWMHRSVVMLAADGDLHYKIQASENKNNLFIIQPKYKHLKTRIIYLSFNLAFWLQDTPTTLSLRGALIRRRQAGRSPR